MGTARDSAGNVVSSDGNATLSGLPYSASISPNADYADYFIITATNGNAFTIGPPSNAKIGRQIAFEINNASGGALGVITWDAVYRIGAFTAPGNGKGSVITFIYNGTNWVQAAAQSPSV